jgi:hypothetical protein
MIKAGRFFLVFAAAAAGGYLARPASPSSRDAFPPDETVLKAYRLTQTCSRAEMDKSFLKRIDTVTPPFPAGSPYQIGDLPTVPGRLTVYKFVASYRGKSEEGERDFHDLLVIETDGTGTILDAYHYTLEWMDQPTLDLYRLQGKGVVLKDGLKIRELDLTNVRTGSPLAEDGIVVLKMGTVRGCPGP